MSDSNIEKMNEIYKRIETILKEKKIKKVDLSRETGIPDSTVLSWKTGVIPNVLNAYKVAQFLGISVEELITGIKENKETPEEKPQQPPALRLSYMESQLLDKYNRLDERDRDILLSLADVMQRKYRGLY